MRWALAVLVAVSFAGCSNAAPPASCVPDDPFCGDAPPVTDSTGYIRGVVVDATIFPMAGVQVRLVGGGAEAANVTDDQGRFLFADLAGGFYTLRIDRPGYEPVNVQAQVVAGEAQPPAVRIVLQAIPGYNPFFVPLDWQGYIQCTTNNANLCLIANYYPQALLGLDPILEDTSVHVWYHEFVDPGRNPDHVQVETVWEATQELGSSLNIRYEVGDLDSVTIPCVFGAQAGESPQVYRINATEARDAGLGAPDPDPDDEGCDEEVAHGFAMEFFAADALGICQSTPVGCHPQFGLVLEQDTQSFIRSFYGYVPPEDWTFIVDGDLLPPR